MQQLHFSRSSKLLVAGLLLAIGGCRVTTPPSGGPDSTNSYCLPPQRFGSGAETSPAVTPTPAPRPAVAIADTTGLPQLSVRSRQLAHAYGLVPALHRLTRLRLAGNGPADETSRAFVRQRHALTLQVVQASADAVRVAQELECEKQRADQAVVGLQGLKSQRTTNLTLGSLLAGAASGTVSATILNPDKANLNLVLTVSTAALSAGLGVATLFVNPRLNYPLPYNMLADVWYQRPQPAFYPAGLWSALNEVRAGRPDANVPAPLPHLRQRWARYDQLTSGKPAQQTQRQELYFGKGGAYQLDELQVRSSMLTQLGVAVRLISEDLQKLLVEVSALEPQ